MLIEIETPDGPVRFKTKTINKVCEHVVEPLTEQDKAIIYTYYNHNAYRFNYFYIQDGWFYVDSSEPDLFPFHKYKVIEE